MNNDNLMIVYGVIMVLCTGCAVLPYSFAQIESESGDGILSCEFVQFCSNPIEIERSPVDSVKVNQSKSILNDTAQTIPETSELMPNVTSNISLIMTPDLPANLVSEDFQRITNEPLQVKNESIDTVSNSLIQNISTNDTLIDSKAILTNETNSESYSTNESINSTLANNNTRPSLGENLANIEEPGWKNFTSTDGYSLSYPQEWNLTIYDNEIYIKSNKLNSEYYPIMTVSIRNMDPDTLNSTIPNVLSFEGISYNVVYSSLFNTNILANIGLKYYIDRDYIVVEPTQKGKYTLDGKQTSVFKVHKLGDDYEIEHITVNNNDKIYNIEINSNYYPSTFEDAAQIQQYKELLLKSIKWMDGSQSNGAVQEIKATESNKTSSNGTKDVVLHDKVTDSNEIQKTISSSESDLNITSSTNFFDGDNFKIVGEVLNKGPNTRELVKVIITLYDSNNNVIGTELTYTNPSDIGSQQSVPFDIIISQGDVANISAINSYKLYLTSDVEVSFNNNQQPSQGSTSIPLDSFSTDVQSPFDSDTTASNPLEKLMDLFKDANSNASSDALSSNFTINESTVSMYPDSFEMTDNIIDASIVPGASVLADTAYDPNPINIELGETIRWTNNDSAFHTVTSGTVGAAEAGKGFDSGLAGPAALTSKGKTFEHTFNEPGEYPYFCTLHPFMAGKIIVG